MRMSSIPSASKAAVSVNSASRGKSSKRLIKLATFQLLISLLFLTTIQASRNQQIILDFDEVQPSSTGTFKESSSDPSQPPHQKTSSHIPSAPAPAHTGLSAKLIKKLTGWNDTVVGKLTGQIAARAPHPFVISITDDNYQDVIESELDSLQPGWGSDDETVWVISVAATDRSSSLFEAEFDKIASNSSLAINPIPAKKREDEVDIVQKEPDDEYLFKPKIRFGRIDYMAKTDFILTKWLIFKCPVLVVITKRGNELRFFRTGAVPPSAEHLGDFLRQERWIHKPVWNSVFSRGNSGEWIVTFMARLFQGIHLVTDRVPGWLLMIITSMLGTRLMQWLHATPASSNSRSAPSSSAQSTSRKTSTNPVAKRTDQSTNNKSDLASEEMKMNLANAAVHLAKITKEKAQHKAR